MKLKIYLVLFVCLSLWSCDNSKELATKFANDLQSALNHNDFNAVKALYPQVTKADRIEFSFNPELLSATRHDDVIEADYGNGVKVNLKVGSDDVVTAQSSYNLFKYDDWTLEEAKLTGQFVAGYTDRKNSLQMHDSIFVWWHDCQKSSIFNSLTESEYKRFTSEYGEVVDGSASNVLDGKMYASGMIDRYGITGYFNFDKESNQFYGAYGYNGKTSGITIHGSLRSNGKMIAIERNSKNRICGCYDGVFRDFELFGEMVNYQYDTFDFHINIQRL